MNSRSKSTMEPTLIIKNERFFKHLEGIPHLETPKRVKAFYEILEDPSIKGRWSEVTPREATVKELAMVHTPEHIERVARTAGKKLSSFDLDTQTTELSYEVARLAVGGVFTLLDGIWKGSSRRGFACVRPPGHHAEPDKAMGFCLFNNAALGAEYLRKRHSAERVMIVDIDVHHGNGTQKTFYGRDDVLYVSLHQFPGYPGTGNYGEVGEGKGEGYTVNIPLGRGHGDRLIVRALYYMVSRLAGEYRPDIILVSCGFDLYMYDRFGEMFVTPEGYAQISHLLVRLAEEHCQGRIVFVMEGGYNLKGIRECGLAVMRELCAVSTLNQNSVEKIIKGSSGKVDEIKKVIEVHKAYWKTLA